MRWLLDIGSELQGVDSGSVKPRVFSRSRKSGIECLSLEYVDGVRWCMKSYSNRIQSPGKRSRFVVAVREPISR